MSSNIANFINAWTPTYAATAHRIEVNNIKQGGNHIMAAIPQGMQAAWTWSLISRVAEVASGPLKAVAIFMKLVCNPLITMPISCFAAIVKEGLYEASFEVEVEAQEIHCYLGDEVGDANLGVASHSIPIRINGDLRYFELGNLLAKETMPWDIKISYKNRNLYFTLGKELPDSEIGIICLRNKQYFLAEKNDDGEGAEVSIFIQSQTLYYNTGQELDRPTGETRTFFVDGRQRHFLNVRQELKNSWGFSILLNAIKPLWIPKFPDRLTPLTIRILGAINDHLVHVVRVVILVSGAIFAIYGQFFMSLGVFSAVGYEFLQHDLGLIPSKISSAIEKHLPLVSMIGLVVCGSVISKIMALASLALLISSTKLWIHQQIDKIARRFIFPRFISYVNKKFDGNQGTSLFFQKAKEYINKLPLMSEFDAPVVENRGLSFLEIQEILEKSDSDYELAPSFHSKPVELLVRLPEDRDFNKLIELWDAKRDFWMQPNTFKHLINRLSDDKRFILFLKENGFNNIKRFYFDPFAHFDLPLERQKAKFNNEMAEYRQEIESYVEQLAHRSGKTKEVFIAEFVKEQLMIFVNCLSAKSSVRGQQAHLANAIEQAAKILPFLTKNGVTQIEIEDSLIKLAIEGGDYCALAKSRVTREVLEGFTEPLKKLGPDGQILEESKLFEQELRYALQQTRLSLIQKGYSFVATVFHAKEATQDTGSDLHLYDALTRVLKRGFYPLKDHEMYDFETIDFLIWETIATPARFALLLWYEQGIPEILRQLSIDRSDFMKNRLLEYLRSWVQQNGTLTSEEKNILLERELSNSEDNLANSDRALQWNRLVLMILGALQPKKRDQLVS